MHIGFQPKPKHDIHDICYPSCFCFRLKSNMYSYVFNALFQSCLSLCLVSINKLYPPPVVPCRYRPGCFLYLLAVSSVSVGELTIIFLLSEQFPIIQPARLAKHCRSSQLSLCLKDKMDMCSDVILTKLNFTPGC